MKTAQQLKEFLLSNMDNENKPINIDHVTSLINYFMNEINLSTINDKDVFYLKTVGCSEYIFSGGNPTKDIVKHIRIASDDVYFSRYGIICPEQTIMELRIATENEIEIFENNYIDIDVKPGDFGVFWVKFKKFGNLGYLKEYDPSELFPYQSYRPNIRYDRFCKIDPNMPVGDLFEKPQ